MRHVFFYTLICITIDTWAQHNTPEKIHFSAPTNNPWDLNKYIWSQTHPTPSKGDKPILDFEAIENWIGVGPDEDLSISHDGKYFAYSIQNCMYRRRDTLVVQSASNSWRQSFAGASPGFFSGDSKQYIFQNKDDLCFLQAGTEQPRCVKAVASYQQPTTGKGEWLAYQLKNSEATLVLEHLPTGTEKRFNGVAGYGFDNSGEWLACQLNNETKELLIFNLVTNMEQRFPSVADYSFSAGEKALVLKTTTKTSNETTMALQYVSLPEGSIDTIWATADSNINVTSYGVDGSGKQVVFTLQEALPGKTDQPNHSIWYYWAGMDKAVLKVNNQTKGINDGLYVQETAFFSDNGRYIQFTLQPQPNPPQPAADAAQVDVWSYKDSILQSTQPYLLKEPKTYRAVFNLQTGQVIQLENEYEKLHLARVNGDVALIIRSGKTIHGDRFWEKDYRKDSNWVVSLKDGSRRLLPTRGGGFMPTLWFSPGDKYLVYFDLERQCHYFSYNLQTGQVVNISTGIPAWQLAMENHLLRPWQQPDKASKPPFPAGLAAWLENDKGLLVYDNYDIWQLDLTGKKPAVNITNGYGRAHKILFSLMGSDRGPYATNLILAAKDTLLLRAFNTRNKYSGFYQKPLGTAGNPVLLSMGPYFFKAFEGRSALVEGMLPLKAAGAQTWIAKRQAATEAPNYFLTSDFKTYTPLTNLQPQKRYNWLTTELHSFKQMDGTMSQGVLYKPENFDPTKKYPVIIAFYSNRADQPYQYPTPQYVMMPDISSHPAWMVSHGYLVFTPDIYFTRGQWGPSTVNTIDGAARYLSQLPFVDAKRLGACGHSNSGRFGYYLLTHSKSFAAMSLGSGFAGTNIISEALSIRKPGAGNESSFLEWAELGSLGSGLGKLWKNKKTWLDHTAILNTDKTQSPLLLFHCKQDDDDIMQAVQLFISLRRLERKAWWLQYDESHHITIPFRDSKDFTIRYTQFFDHYLKAAPPPRWMTKGIPAELKGIERRFEPDPKGQCGNNCPACKAHKSGK